MSDPGAMQQDQSPVQPPEPAKPPPPSPNGAASMTQMPEKRPSRRFFGLLPGRRSS